VNINAFNNWLVKSEKPYLIMGILNVTPDSFSDGGQFLKVENAFTHSVKMIEEGADIIDIGGESTKPFADPVSTDEELSRVIPVIEKIRSEYDILISIDTTKSKVAEEAITAGANIINDVSAMEIDENMLQVAKNYNSPIIMMHMKGIPKNMQNNPTYDHLITEIKDYLSSRVKCAINAGIDKKNIIIDPGIGFGKSVEHNFEIINNLDSFVDLGFPVLLGASRKSFIGLTLDVEEKDRLEGSIAANVIGLQKGAKIFRVHDVLAAKKSLIIANKIFNPIDLIT
tara:strand:- start:3571 stop:4422 length:852 start_codon:yes stop_codon:yes gene_type:complete